MISLFNKMYRMLMGLGKSFADGQNYMSSFFFFFCYRGSSLKIHNKTYLNNLHCLNSLGTIVKVKKTTVIQATERISSRKRALLKPLSLNSRFSVCVYLHFNVGLYLSVLCRWFLVLRWWNYLLFNKLWTTSTQVSGRKTFGILHPCLMLKWRVTEKCTLDSEGEKPIHFLSNSHSDSWQCGILNTIWFSDSHIIKYIAHNLQLYKHRSLPRGNSHDLSLWKYCCVL